MSKETLARRLLELEGFKTQHRALLLDSVRGQFSHLEADQPERPLGAFDLNYLLTAASVLAASSEGRCEDAALRVAQFAVTSPHSSTTQRDAGAVILDSLANRSAVRLAQSFGVPDDYRSRIPLPLRLDSIKREIEHTMVAGPDGRAYYLNRFQRQARDVTRAAPWVSVSAPTSAGKSFLLTRLVEESFMHGARYVTYLVPTRALIHETEKNLRELFPQQGPSPVEVVSVPQLHSDWQSKRMAFVFTQERLYWMLRDAPVAFQLDLVIVDEAHKIADSTRGILLDQVLDELVRRSSSTRVIFSSPMSENPEVLLERAPRTARREHVLSEYAAVNQNMLWAAQAPGRSKDWSLDLIVGQETLVLGTFSLKYRPNPEGKRLPFVAEALGGWSGGNLVYVNGAAAGEKAAAVLADLCPERDAYENDPDLTALSEFAAKVVHPNYALVDTVRHGVAFHYGNMPTLLRSEIEHLFRVGKLRFLVSTSTLLEGVNLATRSVFLRGPTRGRGKQMPDMDFWNLAGRAGRLGEDFQGNVVCVDPQDKSVWKSPPPRTRQRYPIKPSLDAIARDRADELLSFARTGAPLETAKEHPELDYAFSLFVAEHVRWGGVSRSPVAARYAADFIAQVEKECSAALKRCGLPPELVSRHPGINPYAQGRLLAFFSEYEGVLESLIPVEPESTGAVQAYTKLIDLISSHLSGDSLKISFPRALTVVHWMSGWPLARIISSNWKYRQKQNGKNPKKPKSLAQVIRDTMEEVETYARFTFPKYAGCYTDVLRQHLTSLKRTKLVAQVPDLSLWLEFGASQQTQLSLMALGLSRTSAIALSEVMAKDDMTPAEALAWLIDNDVEKRGFSPIIVKEILGMMAAKKVGLAT